MHNSDGMPIEMRVACEPSARWYGYVYFGYVPPALLAGQEAMIR